MVLLDLLKKADIHHDHLEVFIHEWEWVMAVENDLTQSGEDGLLIEFLKLQQDCGVQIDLMKNLNKQHLSLNGAEIPDLIYGIDEGAEAPGENTERTYTAYEVVTKERLGTLFAQLILHVSDPALMGSFIDPLKHSPPPEVPQRASHLRLIPRPL